MRVQQFESLSQGTPSCAHPPDASWQRPGWPPAAVQRPEQQSAVRQHTSPGALQVYAGAHQPSFVPTVAGSPPWQFLEQHSRGQSQRSPSVVHVPPGSEAQYPAVHTPEQQVEPSAHAAPVVLQGAAAQVAPGAPAFGQLIEQQSASEAQGEPAAVQNASVAQTAGVPEHRDEQHSPAPAHVAPWALHGGGAGTTTNETSNVLGVFEAPSDATETVAPYVPTARLPVEGWTVIAYGAAAPETGAASQPEPEA